MSCTMSGYAIDKPTTRRPARGRVDRKRRRQFLILLAVICVIVVVDFPVIWMFLGSIQPIEALMKTDLTLLPSRIDFSNYYKVWFSKDYAMAIRFRSNMLNSFVVCGLSTIIAVCIAVFAGYSLARFRYRFQEGLAQGVLYAYMFPQMLLVIPLLLLVIRLNLYNTLTSLVLVYCSFALPYSIWMMRGYLANIPVELEEAAMVDGCTRVGAFVRVILPLTAPGIAATAIYAFILGWDNVIYPLSFITLEEKKVLSVGFLSMIAGDVTPWSGVMAASVMTSIPVVILFIILQKALVQGLTAGAVKE